MFGILSLVPFALLSGARNQADAKQDLAVIKSLGYPTSESDLPFVSTRKGSDATPDYHAFANLLERQNFGIVISYNDLAKVRPSGAPSLDTDNLRPLIASLLSGASKDHFVRESSSNGEESDFESSIRRNQLLLANMAEADTVRGKTEDAIRETRAAMRMATQIDQAGLPLIHKIPLSFCYRTIHASRGNVPLLRELHADVCSFPPVSPRDSLISYLLLDVYQLNDPQDQYSIRPSAFKKAWDKVWTNRRLQHAAASDINLWKYALQELSKKPYDWKDTQSILRITYQKYAVDPIFHQQGSYLWVCSDAMDTIGGEVAYEHVLATAAQLLLTEATFGTLPNTLPKDEMSIDPFSDRGSQLIYKKLGKGFILYSIGKDRNDDGGLQSKTGITNYDIIFQI